jgi:filamentous hemagglutinin family protein
MSMSMPPKEGWRQLQPTIYATLWQIVVLCLWGSQTVSLANPNGGLVVLGNATIDSTKPGITTITQGSSRAVINWGTFSIGAAEQTIFQQPNASSATLNRVLGNAASILDGRLSANGHVFLINTNGILFGRGAVVDTAGLLASTLDTTNEAFMAGGDMVFQGNSQAAVTNLGQINAASGDVFLIGLQVNNAGVIRAPNGTVGLAAGSDVLIWAAGDERVVVRSAAGAKKDVGVDNSGIIEANVAVRGRTDLTRTDVDGQYRLTLPPGRYVFERIESAAEAGLTDEEQEGLRVGMAEIERGETVPWETIRDEHRSRVAARPTAR